MAVKGRPVNLLLWEKKTALLSPLLQQNVHFLVFAINPPVFFIEAIVDIILMDVFWTVFDQLIN